MAILNILSASESLYHKWLRRYIHFKGRGRGHFRQFRKGLTTFHSSQVIPWGLKSVEISSSNESAYNFEPGPRLLANGLSGLLCLCKLLQNSFDRRRKVQSSLNRHSTMQCVSSKLRAFPSYKQSLVPRWPDKGVCSCNSCWGMKD